MKTFSTSPGGESVRVVPCALCGRESSKSWHGLDSLFVRCTRCGLVYQNPQPVQRDLLERYGDEYYRYEIENESQFHKLMQLGLRDIQFGKIERSMDGVRSFLDIGCATGMLIESMKARGWQEQGVEVCRPAAEHGIRERGVRIHIGTLEQATFPDASFDVVFCDHGAMTFSDPYRTVPEAARRA